MDSGAQHVVTNGSYLIPVMSMLEMDGSRNCQASSGVFGAGPLQVVNETGTSGSLWCGMIAPTNDERLNKGLDFRAGIEKADTFGAEHPLMAVASVEIGVNRFHVERNLAGSMSTVNDRQNARLAAPGTDC